MSIILTTTIEAIQSGFIQVNHGQLYYQKFGSGKPIVVLHGQPLSHSYLLPQMLELAKDHAVIFYDQRGSGNSLNIDINPQYTNLDQFTEDLEKLRLTLKLERIILLGHSFGSILAINYALKYPQHVSNMVLISPGPIDHQGYQNYANEFNKKIDSIKNKVQAFFSYQEIAKLTEQEILELYRTMFSIYFHDTQKLKNLTLNMSKISPKTNIMVWEQMEKMFELKPNTSIFPNLKSIKISTLLVHGKQDIVPRQTAKNIKDTISNAKIIYLEQCGHFPHVEKPKELFPVIREFLKTLG